MTQITPIAHLHSDFPTKFGIPRQSGLVDTLQATIIFEPEYRTPEALRGLEGFSHIWLIWEFSASIRNTWTPTVRPPRLGGNKRVGVFATRSPFRPNSLGLSSVKLDKIEAHSEMGPILYVSGADLMDGTPIFDIKPYVPHTDSHSGAIGGFGDDFKDYHLEVEFPNDLLQLIPEEKRQPLKGVLAQDPRPSYQQDPDRLYGFKFAGFEVKFKVQNHILTVCQVVKLER